ncbi:MAG: hypothetical protein Q8M24_00435 [Pseudolabrys sp.]|nr:hypothetical protein [Pseudolabrys sp.]MDP2293913.1 hypothetical protein [Pseudolabrys sp.]
MGAELGSPQIIADIDQAVAALTGLRKVAVSLHGEPRLPSSSEELPGTNSNNSLNSLTVSELSKKYRDDKSFLERRFNTRGHYLTVIKQIETEIGPRKIADLTVEDIQALYDGWVATRGASMAHGMIGIFRIMIYFGANTLRDPHCERVSVILHRMRFSQPKSTAEKLTSAQADAIRTAARKLNRPSIALAQALQSDLDLSQIDVIGTWVPDTEPGDSDIHYAGNKWLYGLRWEGIDDKFVLRHVTSKQGVEVVIDLQSSERVVEELRLAQGGDGPLQRDKFPATGPVVWCESTDLPWTPAEFRRYWRKAATIAGVPSTVKNGASRGSTSSDKEDGRADVRH